MLEGLDFLQIRRIVHTDLKSENILISFEPGQRSLKHVKIIDFGTSISFSDIDTKLSQTTPEYMPPEALENLEKKASFMEKLSTKLHPWSIDIWSFGVLLLELISGFPLYMAYKGRITRSVRRQ